MKRTKKFLELEAVQILTVIYHLCNLGQNIITLSFNFFIYKMCWSYTYLTGPLWRVYQIKWIMNYGLEEALIQWGVVAAYLSSLLIGWAWFSRREEGGNMEVD